MELQKSVGSKVARKGGSKIHFVRSLFEEGELVLYEACLKKVNWFCTKRL
jgi:hypothetical protein